MKSTPMKKPCVCLDCGQRLDAVTNTTGRRKPRPGNIMLCAYCGHIMAFADDLTLRQLTDAECHHVAGNPDIIKLQKARAEAFAKYQESKDGSKAKQKPSGRTVNR